jgi:hypothetical protein
MTLLASSKTFGGIETLIAEFYAGEKKQLRQVSDTEWTVHRGDGRQLQVRVALVKGRYRFETV